MFTKIFHYGIHQTKNIRYKMGISANTFTTHKLMPSSQIYIAHLWVFSNFLLVRKCNMALKDIPILCIVYLKRQKNFVGKPTNNK